MLLEFKSWNYKSFREELHFTMIPSNVKELSYSIQKEKVKEKEYKALSTAVIYGPNAAGKTNIIGAMDSFRSIVLRGHINDLDESEIKSPDVAAYMLTMIPYCYDKSARPIGFQIRFIDDGLLVDYTFKANVGTFLEEKAKRNIEFEQLLLNDTLVFSRNNNDIYVEDGGLKELENLSLLIKQFDENSASAIALAKANLKEDELFLENGFKSLISTGLVESINNWLQRKFHIIYRASELRIRQKITPGKGRIDKRLTDALKVLGMGADQIGYAALGEKDDEGQLCSIILDHGKKAKDEKWRVVSIDANIFESYGTVRFAALYRHLLYSMMTGATLVVDEFDASLHPMALMSIINIFHNDEINIHHAQLIFNTHNPIFLNNNLFRRDEIKFVERDKSGYSVHYSLSDFSTKGGVGTRVRNSSDYMKNYFINSYGAIEDIDFSPVFEEALKDTQKEGK